MPVLICLSKSKVIPKKINFMVKSCKYIAFPHFLGYHITCLSFSNFILVFLALDKVDFRYTKMSDGFKLEMLCHS